MSANEDIKPTTNGVEAVGEKADLPTGLAADLSPEYREFLLQRHGTLELDPIPAFDDADPYNWPAWKVGTRSIPKHVTVLLITPLFE
jgi:hypothetical protein